MNSIPVIIPAMTLPVEWKDDDSFIRYAFMPVIKRILNWRNVDITLKYGIERTANLPCQFLHLSLVR